MVLALIVTIPHSLPMQTKHIQTENSRTTNVMWICVRGAHKWHMQGHNTESQMANTTLTGPSLKHRQNMYTQSVSKCAFVCSSNGEMNYLLLGVEVHCGVAGWFFGMIGRLRAIERPIWPHFNFDGPAYWFPAAELPPRLKSHTYINTYSRYVTVCIFMHYTWMCTWMLPEVAGCCSGHRTYCEKWKKRKLKRHKKMNDAERDGAVAMVMRSGCLTDGILVKVKMMSCYVISIQATELTKVLHSNNVKHLNSQQLLQLCQRPRRKKKCIFKTWSEEAC